MNPLTFDLINFINSRVSGFLLTTDERLIPFTEIVGVMPGLIQFVTQERAHIQTIDGSIISRVLIDPALVVRETARLRGERQYREAIDLIVKNIKYFPDESRVNGLLEAYYAADESGFVEVARSLAQIIHAEEPDLPTIQKYLI